jgi:hypothetical protein
MNVRATQRRRSWKYKENGEIDMDLEINNLDFEVNIKHSYRGTEKNREKLTIRIG